MDDKETSKRLWKLYRITLEEYNQILENQNGVCKICGKPPKDIRLAVDHDHRAANRKYAIKKLDYGYGAVLKETGKSIGAGLSKLDARQNGKSSLIRMSIRGLLCSQCNRALGKVENPRWQWGPKQLRAAADYLENYQKWQKTSDESALSADK